MIPQINHRDQLGKFLQVAGMDGIGVEVGCAFGGFSKTIMREAPSLRLYMVDPYVNQPSDVYPEEAIEKKPYEEWFKEVSALPSQGFNCEIIRDFSVSASKIFTPLSLDFVYLDGNHSLRAVEDDIAAWYPKIKRGGLFGGHDYNYVNAWTQVFVAVSTWAAKSNLPFTVCPCGSWFLFKP